MRAFSGAGSQSGPPGTILFFSITPMSSFWHILDPDYRSLPLLVMWIIWHRDKAKFPSFQREAEKPCPIWKRQQWAENIQSSLTSVNPVFYSYLGFGLKAARLATLGALETEGLSEYQLVAGDRESDAKMQLASFLRGIPSMEQRVMLTWEANVA